MKVVLFRATVGLLALMCGLGVTAAEVRLGPLTLDLPVKWHIKRDGSRGLSASPSRDMSSLPLFSIEVCQRSTQSECATPCQTDKIHENFFYAFMTDPTKSRFDERARPDGFKEYTSSGTIDGDDGPGQIASRVLCSERGIAYLVLMSKESKEKVDSQLESVSQSIKWKLEPPTAASRNDPRPASSAAAR
jgi:hypothetical protein